MQWGDVLTSLRLITDQKERFLKISWENEQDGLCRGESENQLHQIVKLS
jgi:hypothetical protein